MTKKQPETLGEWLAAMPRKERQSFKVFMMMEEARASVALDSKEGVHTCHDECPCHEEKNNV